MAVSPLLHQTHEVLNPDFCSGYIDAFGKWNTGFPCPWLDSAAPGFCCGTETYKYCCSGKLRLVTAPPPTPEDPLLLVLAVTLGVAAGITLLILIACFVCPGCLLHKKRRPGPLYRLPCSSTMSTYVPTTAGVAAITSSNSSGGGGGGNMRTHPMSFHHDVRPSASFLSFNGGGMASLYSLSEPDTASTMATTVASVGDNNNVDQQQQQQYSDEYSTSEETNRHLHHLFWSRQHAGAGGHHHHQQQQQQPASNQGHHILRHCQQEDPSPPPPYHETDYRHIHHLHNRMTQQQQQQQQAALLLDAVVGSNRQLSGSSNISPRQPALCIIDDAVHRDGSVGVGVFTEDHHHHHHPQLTYHSTKF